MPKLSKIPLIARVGALLVVTTLTCGGCKNSEQSSSNTLDPSVSRPHAIDKPRNVARVFISGHSLIDQPVPNDLEKIAASLGSPIQWNRQYIVGSSILRRSKGSRDGAGWDGYREGLNRDGEGLDVVGEFAAPRTIEGGSYDTLLITEQHGLLDALLWNDTVRYLRHYHDRFIAGNASGTTFFYEPWLDVADKSDPASWIAYEKDASPIWQCLVTRINVSLAHEGRSDRIVSIPAGLSLVHLIETATGTATVEGITRADVKQTLDTVFSDTVHLTPLGAYYVSLVAYASMFGRDPVGAWHPPELERSQAMALQRVAARFVQQYYAAYGARSLDECRRLLADGSLAHVVSYMRDTRWRAEEGSMRAHIRWLRLMAQSKYSLGRNDRRNPLHFDPDTDSSFWLTDP